MLKNYLKIALRTLQKYKGYTLINVFGLAIGLASAILIMLYVQDELSYDQHHQKKDRIYRITFQGKIRSSEIHSALSSNPMGPVMRDEYPAVEEMTRLRATTNSVIRVEDRKYIEDHLFFADSTVFNVFTMPFIEGNPHKALSEPNKVVLTQSTAEKYFGDASPLGKTIEWANGNLELEVTGVMKDCPETAHFQYDLLVSYLSSNYYESDMWLSTNVYTYLLLQDGYTASEMERQFPAMVKKYVGPQVQEIFGSSWEKFNESGYMWSYHLQPLTDIYLQSDLDNEIGKTGSMNNVYFFSVIAFFLILIAAINFMNLATAKSANRAKEVGVKKVTGSSRRQLIFQFITEAMMITFLGLLLSIVLVEVAMPFFNNLADKSLDIHYFKNPIFLVILLGIGIVVGLMAGSYPAFYLSAFNPVTVLKGKLSGGSKNSRLRGVLVVFQFIITIVLVVSTIVVGRQMQYINQKDLGFNKKHVMVINRVSELGTEQDAFRQELLSHPNILSASFSRNVPGGMTSSTAFYPEGSTPQQSMVIDFSATDPYYDDTYGIEMSEGRFFSEDYATDSLGILINEAAKRKFGFDKAVGKNVVLMQGNEGEDIVFEVVGVMKNFNFRSLHHEIQPLIFYYINDHYSHMSLQLRPGQMQETLEFIRGKWGKFVSATPLDYSFLKNDWEAKYRQEQKVGTLFKAFSLLAIVISCLGLFGLASFMAAQRTKEIGVRKVFGASIPQILKLLSKEILILIAIATGIGWPLGYYFMNEWLQDFAYRIDISWVVFVLASVITLLVALLTVSYRALRAATANPAESLKDE
ncbi:MAG TPA: ABC transporter permease [Bacteroidales bacterium]|nr:ABC transporter permease [Bacteroidales bacterium]